VRLFGVDRNIHIVEISYNHWNTPRAGVQRKTEEEICDSIRADNEEELERAFHAIP